MSPFPGSHLTPLLFLFAFAGSAGLGWAAEQAWVLGEPCTAITETSPCYQHKPPRSCWHRNEQYPSQNLHVLPVILSFILYFAIEHADSGHGSPSEEEGRRVNHQKSQTYLCSNFHISVCLVVPWWLWKEVTEVKFSVSLSGNENL